MPTMHAAQQREDIAVTGMQIKFISCGKWISTLMHPTLFHCLSRVQTLYMRDYDPSICICDDLPLRLWVLRFLRRVCRYFETGDSP